MTRIIKRATAEKLKPVSFPAAEPTSLLVPEADCQATIECIRTGTRIDVIEVRCSCGQITRLQCKYK